MKILIVDDEMSIQRLFLQRFRKEIKANILTLYFANSAKEALSLLNQFGQSDWMILSDINMPNMSGLELLKIVKQLYPSIAVYMLTAYDDNENREQANRLGASGYLTKPINFSFLKQQLNIPV